MEGIYWQNYDLPFVVIRQTGKMTFECFDREDLKWKPYSRGYDQVLINNECHRISEEEANRIINLLSTTDIKQMGYHELCALVRQKGV